MSNLLNILSKYFGKFAETEFPSPIQKIINSSYVKLLKINLSEFKDSDHYYSLQQIFTRNLSERRYFSEDPKAVIAPVDSRITQFGRLNKNKLLQIKGMSFNVSDLLTLNVYPPNIRKILNGEYINFHLRPKDYHHYHAPCDLKVFQLIHIPGKLYPVKHFFLKTKKDLFVENERVVLECQTKNHKLIYLICIGATLVGKIHIAFEPGLITNTDSKKIKVVKYVKPKEICKGDDFGYFKMGSTVVVLFQKNLIKFRGNLKPNQEINYCGTIGKFLYDNE